MNNFLHSDSSNFYHLTSLINFSHLAQQLNAKMNLVSTFFFVSSLEKFEALIIKVNKRRKCIVKIHCSCIKYELVHSGNELITVNCERFTRNAFRLYFNGSMWCLAELCTQSLTFYLLGPSTLMHCDRWRVNFKSTWTEQTALEP